MPKLKYNYPEIIRIYNSDGAKEAYSHIRKEYSTKDPYAVVRKMRRNAAYHYDSGTDSFVVPNTSDSDALFMGLDELCCKSPGISPKAAVVPSMESLVKDLVQDRLLQLSRYVLLSHISKTVMVDRSTMISDGFNVVIY
jgi:hypothetical protein